MAEIYCEVCGQGVGARLENPKKVVLWIHLEAQKPVTCNKHGLTRLFLDAYKLKFDPLTGKAKNG